MDDNLDIPITAPPSKLVPALLVANSVLLAGVLAVVLLGSGGDDAPPAEADKAPAVDPKVDSAAMGPVTPLADFVVHLRNPEANRYVRVTFEVELRSDEDKPALEARMPMIRDAVIAYLSDRTAEEIKGSEGIARVKQALHERLDQVVPGRRVRALYITSLVVQ